MTEPELLSAVLQEAARLCHQELYDALAEPADFQATLLRAKGRFLRLSILLSSCDEDGIGFLEPAAAVEHVLRQLESNSGDAQAERLAEDLAQKRMELVEELATQQTPVQVAAGLLQGFALPGCLGVPSMLGDLLAGRDDWCLSRTQRRAAQCRLSLGARASLARSRITEALQPEAAVPLKLELCPDGVVLTAPGAFVLQLQFNLTWRVLGFRLEPQGLGALLRLPDESAAQQLQAVADMESKNNDADIPATLAAAAHAFCSHLWLRATLDEAIRASGQLSQVSSASWDRRGFVSMRVFPGWDSTCGGICSPLVDEVAGPSTGCILELHKAEGGLRPELAVLKTATPGTTPLPCQRPQRLVELGGVAPCLDEVLRQAHESLACLTLRRLRAGLLEVLPLSRAKPLEASQLELLPDGRPLRCLLRGCQVYIDLDSLGRLVLSTSEYSELLPKVAGGQEAFILRLEAVRLASLTAAAEGVLADAGWRRVVPPEPPPRHENFRCHFGETPLGGAVAVEFDLADTEVANLRLLLEDGSRIDVVSMDNFCFAQTGDHALPLLRSGLRKRLSIAQRLLETNQLSCEVLPTLARHAKLLQAGSIQLRFNGEADGAEPVELELNFCEASGSSSGNEPSLFEPPLRCKVHRSQWSLWGKLRSPVPLSDSVQAPKALPCGGILETKVSSSGEQEVEIRFDQVALQSATWLHWSRDLRALAQLADFRCQAENVRDELPGLHLEMSRPDYLRFRLCSPHGDEVFSLVPTPTTKAEVELPCSFQWLEPRTSFLLAQRLSRRLNRTRRLKDCLSAILAAAELVRCVEELVATSSGTGSSKVPPRSARSEDNFWSSLAISANTLQVECRGMLGVEIAAIDATTFRLTCLSRRQRSDGRMSVLPNLEPFVEWLQTALGSPTPVPTFDGDAPGRTLRIPTGSLKRSLSPLWTYVRMYLTLLQLYLIQRRTASESRCEIQPTSQAEWPCWVRLQTKMLDAAVGFTLVTEVETEEARSKRRRLEVPKIMPQLHFFWGQGSDETKDVLQRFEAFFKQYLAPKRTEGNAEPNWEKLRVSRLHPLLELLHAPRVWMLREIVRLLPPLWTVAAGRNGEAKGSVHSEWQPLVEHFSLRHDGANQAPPRFRDGSRSLWMVSPFKSGCKHVLRLQERS
ncbi:unnamed protein product [Durusdinium trenchii]|uniref:Mediator of RNA polymerase II transcription subunit 14 n=1 Tax=Durusdinium trenchii TaxID=1381693 RepID=A0ABP0JSM2_9DINO